MSAFAASFRREVALMWAGGGALAPLGFFLGATMLVPLAMGPERTLLQAAGPPLVWLSSAPLEALVLAKGAALWCVVGLPLALAGAPAAIALQAPVEAVPLIVASL